MPAELLVDTKSKTATIISLTTVIVAGIVLIVLLWIVSFSTASAPSVFMAAGSSDLQSVTLRWTAPGDNGDSGRASVYDIRYATHSISGANWASASKVTNEPAPATAGSTEELVIGGLQPETTYYFALKTADEAGNWSSLSNIASKKTGSASCTESWSCGSWSDCVDNQRTRTCLDNNGCGTTDDRPAIQQSCQSSSNCLEDWHCTAWSACINNAQTRTCTDANDCGTTNDKPAERYDCTSGNAPNADDVEPNTQITSSPGTLHQNKIVTIAWRGTDDVSNSSTLVYSYKVDDEAWSAWDSQTTTTYREMRNGEHTFLVRSRDEAKNVDSTPAEVTFTVRREPFIVVGVNQGGGPMVRIFNTNGELLSQFFAFEADFRGGITVATGDFGGDGVDEIVVGSGPGRVAEVRIFRRDGSVINSFRPYGDTFFGGVSVASGDIEGDGLEEIATAPVSGGGPVVRVFGYRDTEQAFVPVVPNFYAYHQQFRGGVSLAFNDIEGDGKDELVTAPMGMGGPQLRFFGIREKTFKEITPGLMAYDPAFRGGLTLVSGQVNDDEPHEIITGIYSMGGPHIRIFGRTRYGIIGLVHPGFFGYMPQFRGGVSVATLDYNYDGYDEIVTAVRSNSDALIRIFDANGGVIYSAFYGLPQGLHMGVNIVAGE